MNLKRNIFIRYRDDGHVRFELPAELCQSGVAGRLIEGLRGVEGVYRVDLSPRQRKLSIRFMDTVVDFVELARSLGAIVDDIEEKSLSAINAPAVVRNWRLALQKSSAARWFREKFVELRETAQAAAILAKARHRKPIDDFLMDQTVVDFLTDVLVLYLIKTHWRLVINDWIRRPWQYKSEWLASFYLVFLLVRSRMPKSSD